MKAIGMRNFSIQKIYQTKYFAVVMVGAAVGILLSIPVGALMMKSVSGNMALGGSTDSLWINLVCGVAIIIFVTGMSVLFTRKLRKVFAIEAIRSSANGEQYQRRRGLVLYKRRYMGTISKIIFADEPTEAGQAKFQGGYGGTTIMMVTHDAKVASQCERVFYIEDGNDPDYFNRSGGVIWKYGIMKAGMRATNWC